MTLAANKPEAHTHKAITVAYLRWQPGEWPTENWNDLSFSCEHAQSFTYPACSTTNICFSVSDVFEYEFQLSLGGNTKYHTVYTDRLTNPLEKHIQSFPYYQSVVESRTLTYCNSFSAVFMWETLLADLSGFYSSSPIMAYFCILSVLKWLPDNSLTRTSPLRPCWCNVL